MEGNKITTVLETKFRSAEKMTEEELQRLVIMVIDERDCWIHNCNQLQKSYNKLEAQLKAKEPS